MLSSYEPPQRRPPLPIEALPAASAGLFPTAKRQVVDEVVDGCA